MACSVSGRLGLDDSLDINENLTLARAVTINGTLFPTGTNFVVNDSFHTQNRFYGGQVGLDMEYKLGNWVFDAKPMVALGSTNEVVNINGNTIITVPGVSTNAYSGGLLAELRISAITAAMRSLPCPNWAYRLPVQ